jgi:polysaccharide pyruvyl transferase WcaK-like protein
MGTDAKRRKIALFGNFGTGNLGNECTLQAMLYNLRRCIPNAEISCICPRPEDTALRYSISAFPIRAPFPIRELFKMRPRKDNGAKERSKRTLVGIPIELQGRFKAITRLKALFRAIAYPLLAPYRWFKAITVLSDSEMLVMTGTGMLGDFGIRPLGLHYDILAWSIMAKLCRCKLLFVSVGAGPISHPVSRYLVKVALALADYRSYRDTFSKTYLESIGFDVRKDTVYPDLAFSLPRAMLPYRHIPDGHGSVIGVGLMNYYNRRATSEKDETIYRDYIAKVAIFVAHLLERNYTVRILIGDIAYDNSVRQHLRELLEARGLKYESRKIIDEPASSVEMLLSQLVATDVVIASRYHNVLLALMLSKPVVAISYHNKFDPLMTGVGLAEFSLDIEHIDIRKLIEQLTHLEENLENLKTRLERKTEIYRRALDEQYDRIFQEVLP